MFTTEVDANTIREELDEQRYQVFKEIADMSSTGEASRLLRELGNTGIHLADLHAWSLRYEDENPAEPSS